MPPTKKSSSSRAPSASGEATQSPAREERKSGPSTPPHKRVTIKSVAEAAGVSIATVSFVLNDRPGQVISPPVRQRVLETARRLNYAPSAAAAGLARKQTANVAILFYRNDHLITNQLYSFVVQGAIKEASAREYNVLFSFMQHEFQDYNDLPKVVREKNAEGVLFIQDVSEPLFRELTSRGIRAVAVDSHPHVDGLDAIYADNETGARLAAAHLIELGHQSIAFLHASADRPSISERSRAFVAELTARGLTTGLERPFIEAEELTFQAGYRAAREALRQRPSLTGIACANDELAAGVIRASRELGRRVPQDLSIVGFDDIIMARYLDPPLSTITYDREAMGRWAMSRLLEQVQGNDVSVPPKRLAVEVVQRASSGPAPQRC